MMTEISRICSLEFSFLCVFVGSVKPKVQMTQIMAIEDFQQTLNNSCSRGINVKCLPFINYNKNNSKGKYIA